MLIKFAFIDDKNHSVTNSREGSVTMNSYIFSLFILLLPVSFVLSFSEMETKVSINADGQDDACFDENFGS